jgi:hypothetical protein
MKLNSTLFWDIDIATLDYELHSRLIVERVLTRGNLTDWFELLGYYGLEKIKSEALQIRYLDDLTLHFCSLIFGVPKNQFRCYTQNPFIPTPLLS